MAKKNTRAAGKRFESKIKNFLESLGYLVEVAHPKMCFLGQGKVISKSHDMFGCADIIAIRPEKKVLFIQASTNEGTASQKRNDMQKLPFADHYDCQVWLRDISARNRIIVWNRIGCSSWIETSFRLKDGEWATSSLGCDPNDTPAT